MSSFDPRHYANEMDAALARMQRQADVEPVIAGIRKAQEDAIAAIQAAQQAALPGAPTETPAVAAPPPATPTEPAAQPRVTPAPKSAPPASRAKGMATSAGLAMLPFVFCCCGLFATTAVAWAVPSMDLGSPMVGLISALVPCVGTLALFGISRFVINMVRPRESQTARPRRRIG